MRPKLALLGPMLGPSSAPKRHLGGGLGVSCGVLGPSWPSDLDSDSDSDSDPPLLHTTVQDEDEDEGEDPRGWGRGGGYLDLDLE